MESNKFFQDNLLESDKQKQLDAYELELSEVESNIEEIKTDLRVNWNAPESKDKDVVEQTTESDEDIIARLNTEAAKYFSRLLEKRKTLQYKIGEIRKDEFSLN
jgi:hypothetical protein